MKTHSVVQLQGGDPTWRHHIRCAACTLWLNPAMPSSCARPRPSKDRQWYDSFIDHYHPWIWLYLGVPLASRCISHGRTRPRLPATLEHAASTSAVCCMAMCHPGSFLPYITADMAGDRPLTRPTEWGVHGFTTVDRIPSVIRSSESSLRAGLLWRKVADTIFHVFGFIRLANRKFSGR